MNSIRERFKSETGLEIDITTPISAHNVTHVNREYVLWLEKQLESVDLKIQFLYYYNLLINRIKKISVKVNLEAVKKYFSPDKEIIKKLIVKKDRLTELANTDRYKKSGYVIEKVNGYYGLRHKGSGKYVDLVSPSHKWYYGSSYNDDCFGSVSDVIDGFDYLNPIIVPLNIEETY